MTEDVDKSPDVLGLVESWRAKCEEGVDAVVDVGEKVQPIATARLTLHGKFVDGL